MAFHDTPVLSLTRTTDAPGKTAPLGSETAPLIAPRKFCALRDAAANSTTRRARNTRRVAELLMGVRPPEKSWPTRVRPWCSDDLPRSRHSCAQGYVDFLYQEVFNKEGRRDAYALQTRKAGLRSKSRGV